MKAGVHQRAPKGPLKHAERRKIHLVRLWAVPGAHLFGHLKHKRGADPETLQKGHDRAPTPEDRVTQAGESTKIPWQCDAPAREGGRR